MRKIFLFAIFFSAAITLVAQQEMNSLKNLEFLAGKWKADHRWGKLVEIWSAPVGNAMMGSFQCVKDDKLVFYEFMVIEEQPAAAPKLFLRHFGPGNIAWEDKNKPLTLALISYGRDSAVFERTDKKQRFYYNRTSMITMNVMMESQNASGAWSKEHFEFTREFQ